MQEKGRNQYTFFKNDTHNFTRSPAWKNHAVNFATFATLLAGRLRHAVTALMSSAVPVIAIRLLEAFLAVEDVFVSFVDDLFVVTSLVDKEIFPLSQ